MIVYDVATKVLIKGGELFPQQNIADLISGITFVVQSTQRITLKENKEIIMSDDNAAEIWNTFLFYNVTLRSKDIQIITL